MKKTGFTQPFRTPSVKSSYTAFCLLLFLLPIALVAQKPTWEFGVALKPTTFKEDPYALILKRNISRYVSIRSGIGLIYKKNDETVHYKHPYPDTIHALAYSRVDVHSRFSVNAFVGLQYGKRFKDLFVYMATDFVFKYQFDKLESPEGTSFTKFNIYPYSGFITTKFVQDNILSLTGKQSIGIQYFINQDLSISIEGGFYYERTRTKRISSQASILKSGDPDVLMLKYELLPNRQYWNYTMGASPLSFLMLNYHF